MIGWQRKKHTVGLEPTISCSVGKRLIQLGYACYILSPTHNLIALPSSTNTQTNTIYIFQRRRKDVNALQNLPLRIFCHKLRTHHLCLRRSVAEKIEDVSGLALPLVSTVVRREVGGLEEGVDVSRSLLVPPEIGEVVGVHRSLEITSSQ